MEKGAEKELSIYIHVPFCVQKCLYCDFLSFPADRKAQERYMRALLAELEREAPSYRDYRVTTVFIGGGTPTAVDALWIERLMACLYRQYAVTEDAEITMEMNPGTVTRESLLAYYGCGINRVSIGLQSAEEEELAKLGRIHSYGDFLRTYRETVDAGFTNINVDIMSALPGQTVASYDRTLEKVLHLVPPPAHISAYSLIVEEGTPFYVRQQEGCLPLPDEDEERDMYVLTGNRLLAAGYHRYEISNYARPGFACRHNVVYWTRGNYAGFGLGAASMVENVRFQNETDLTQYLARVEAGKGPVKGAPLSVQEQMEEFMFLGLRLTQGIREEQFRECFGTDIDRIYKDVLEKHIKEGLLERKEGIRLTERGLDVSNYVMADFIFSS